MYLIWLLQKLQQNAKDPFENIDLVEKQPFLVPLFLFYKYYSILPCPQTLAYFLLALLKIVMNSYITLFLKMSFI